MAPKRKSLFSHVLDAIGRILDPSAPLRDPRRYQHIYKRTVNQSFADAWKAIGDDLQKVMDRKREQLRREGKML